MLHSARRWYVPSGDFPTHSPPGQNMKLNTEPIRHVLELFNSTEPSPSERHCLAYLSPTSSYFRVDNSQSQRRVHFLRSHNARQLQVMCETLIVATKRVLYLGIRTLAKYAAQRHGWRDIVNLIDRDELTTTDMELLVSLLVVPASRRNRRYDGLRLLVEVLRAVALHDLRNRYEQG